MPAFLLPVIAFYSAVPSWAKKLVAGGLILLAIFFAGEMRGKRVARAECEAQARRAQTAADQQDKQADVEVREQEKQLVEALTQQKKVDDAVISKLQLDLAKRPKSAPCLYDKSNSDPDDPPARVRK